MRVFEATKSLAYSKARASSAIVELEKSFMRLHSEVNALVEQQACFWTIVLCSRLNTVMFCIDFKEVKTEFFDKIRHTVKLQDLTRLKKKHIAYEGDFNAYVLLPLWKKNISELNGS